MDQWVHYPDGPGACGKHIWVCCTGAVFDSALNQIRNDTSQDSDTTFADSEMSQMHACNQNQDHVCL